MTPNKSPSNMRKITITYLFLMSAIYISFGLLGMKAFELRKENLLDGDSFL